MCSASVFAVCFPVFYVLSVSVLSVSPCVLSVLSVCVFCDSVFSVSVCVCEVVTGDVWQIGCGYAHSVVLTEAGELFTFGVGTYGQLGLNGTHMEIDPQRVRPHPAA